MKESVEVLLTELAQDFKNKVLSIENGTKMTKDHYGEYLSLLTNFKDSQHQKIIALAVIEAGKIAGFDNQSGVRSALRIMGH